MITDKPDIFDRIMSLKIFKWANPFYTKYKEVLMYLLFGGLTTLVSVGVFALFESHFGLNEHISKRHILADCGTVCVCDKPHMGFSDKD